jgi:hypothetical protein
VPVRFLPLQHFLKHFLQHFLQHFLRRGVLKFSQILVPRRFHASLEFRNVIAQCSGKKD